MHLTHEHCRRITGKTSLEESPGSDVQGLFALCMGVGVHLNAINIIIGCIYLYQQLTCTL